MRFILSLLLLASPLPAAVIYSGSQNLSVAWNDLEGVFINIVTGETATTWPADFDDAPWVNVTLGGYGVFNMALHLDNINTLGTNPPTASVQVTNPTVNPIATIANPFPASLVPTNTIFNVTSAEVDRNHREKLAPGLPGRRSNAARIPRRISAGSGGQPWTNASTGTNSSTLPATA